MHLRQSLLEHNTGLEEMEEILETGKYHDARVPDEAVLASDTAKIFQTNQLMSSKAFIFLLLSIFSYSFYRLCLFSAIYLMLFAKTRSSLSGRSVKTAACFVASENYKSFLLELVRRQVSLLTSSSPLPQCKILISLLINY